MSMPSAFSLSNVLLVASAISVALFLKANPIIYGGRVNRKDVKPDGFTVYTRHPLMDRALDAHRSEIGDDYVPYRNHCLRVLSFAVYHRERQRDPPSSVADDSDVDLMALALAYHDIGLWVDGGELDYLEPSADALAREAGRYIPNLTDGDAATLRQMVMQHHKVTRFVSSPPADASSPPVDDGLVNAVRMADWADATVGIVRHGLPYGCIEAAYDAVPEAGFHVMLAGMGHRLRPGSFLGGRLAIPDIFRW